MGKRFGFSVVAAVALGFAFFVGCGTGSVEPALSGTDVSVSLTAAPTTITAGGAATLSWTSANADTLNIEPGIGAVGAAGNQQVSPSQTTTYTITAARGTVTRAATATVIVEGPPPPPALQGNFSWKGDPGRTGLNQNESVLKQSNVNVNTFGRLFSDPVDGVVFAQPLYVKNVAIPNQGTHDVVFIATERASVYAFDANAAGGPLWKRSLIDPANGVTTVPNDGKGRTGLGPEAGITGTPAIDPDTGIMYVSVMTLVNGVARHTLHALDITTGVDKFPSKMVTASVPGTGVGTDGNGMVPFQPLPENQRAGLVLHNGVLYVAWGSFNDEGEYHGWLMAFDDNNLNLISAFNTAPDGEGSSIWQSGAAPAIDAEGNIYVMTGDGHQFNANTGGKNYGDSFIKLRLVNNQLTVVDWFTPFNEHCIDVMDLDLGAGGPMLVPQQSGGKDILIAVGKEGRIYVLDRNNMGHFQTGSDSQILQSIVVTPNPCGAAGFDANSTWRMYGTPAYWNGNVYTGSAFGPLRGYRLADARLTEFTTSNVIYEADGQQGRGPIPVVSANGTSDPIVWTVHKRLGDQSNSVLRAFDANDLKRELYNSEQNPGRDALAGGTVFMVPLVINGKVYVTAGNRLHVFGLLP
jgi:hypothetical protein